MDLCSDFLKVGELAYHSACTMAKERVDWMALLTVESMDGTWVEKKEVRLV